MKDNLITLRIDNEPTEINSESESPFDLLVSQKAGKIKSRLALIYFMAVMIFSVLLFFYR